MRPLRTCEPGRGAVLLVVRRSARGRRRRPRPRSRCRRSKRPTSRTSSSATSKGCRPASACSSSGTGPRRARRTGSSSRSPTIGRHPDSDIFLDDITVSRRHVVAREGRPGIRAARRRLAQRHLREPRAGRRSRASHHGDEVQIGRYRLSFVLGRDGGGVARWPTRAHVVDRRRAQPAARRVPRHHDLQDPLPREPRPRRTRAHAVGLPQVLRRRRRTAALRPAPAARALPAAEGDQGPARRSSTATAALAAVVAPTRRRRASADRRRPRPAPTRRRGKRPSKEPVLFEETREAREQAEAREVDRRRSPTRPAPTTSRRRQSGVSLTRAELAQAAGHHRRGARPARGIRPRRARRTRTRDRVLFDEDALAVARIAAGFMRHGIEPRHLRMYRAFAEREAGLFEQVLLPYRRQRNPEAQARTRRGARRARRPRPPAAHRRCCGRPCGAASAADDAG